MDGGENDGILHDGKMLFVAVGVGSIANPSAFRPPFFFISFA